MSSYDIDFSASSMINQQVAGEVFSVLPEDGPLVVILDGQGNYWPSDAEKYSVLFCDSYRLDQILARIDDGEDPVISDIDGCPVVASQLATKERHCGYIIIALEGHTQERVMQNQESIEMSLSLINVIGNFVEKYNNIRQFQNKYLTFAQQQEAVSLN